jgi:hypothetical protein
MKVRWLISLVALLVLPVAAVTQLASLQEEEHSSQKQDHVQTEPGENAPSSAPAPATQIPAPEPGSPRTTKPVAIQPKKRTIKKKKTVKSVTSQSSKVVVHHGGAAEITAQLSPGMTQEQVIHERETTEQLLASTDANLKKLSARQLTPAQQGVVDQVRNYMRQSKVAGEAGDVARARTLAYKAHLLSDDLARK